MMTQDEKDLLDTLRRIKAEGPINSGVGICDAIAARKRGSTEDLIALFEDLSLGWPKHSGNFCFPVPDPTGGFPGDAYMRHHAPDMWSPDHPYGALRLELLDWCIAELEKKEGESKCSDF